MIYSKVVGYRSDLDRVELLYTSLLLQATTQVVRQHPPAGTTAVSFRRSWFLGFNGAVEDRLRAAERAAMAEAASAAPAASTNGVSTELMLADRTAHVDLAFADAFPEARNIHHKVRSHGGYGAGRTAGNQADLNQPRVGARRTAVR